MHAANDLEDEDEDPGDPGDAEVVALDATPDLPISRELTAMEKEVRDSVLMRIMTTQHGDIVEGLRGVEKAVDRQTEKMSQPTFLERAGKVILDGAASFCQSVGGHRAGLLLVLLVTLIPVIYMMAGTGMQLRVGDWFLLGPVPQQIEESTPDGRTN